MRRYASLLSSAENDLAMAVCLAERAPAVVGASSAAVVVEEAPGRFVARVAPLGSAIPSGTALEADVVGPEMAEEIRLAAGREYRRAMTVPLLSGRSIVGALILLWREEAVLDQGSLDLVEAMAEITAMAIDNHQQIQSLRRSYEELRASREALVRSEKLRALGQMATGIAHDLKNILNPIALHLQFLSRALPADQAEARDSVEQMRDAVKRGVQTIDRLREFARQEPASAAATIDLGAIAAEAIALVRPRLASRAAQGKRPIAVAAEPGAAPAVAAHGAELVGAVVNLLVNAIDAMSDGGRVVVRTGSRAPGRAFIEVEDDGPGMPPEIAAQAFEPFFTTKGAEGTGLGLAMVDVTARRHGGHATLDTTPGKGTRITLELPGQVE